MKKTKKFQIDFQMKVGIAIIAIMLLVVGTAKVNALGNFWVGVQQMVADKIFEQMVNVGNVSVDFSVPEPEPTLGALSSPDIVSPYLSVAGDITYHYAIPFAASTTLVAIPTPFRRATTTAADVVLWQNSSTSVASSFGYTGATSTVELIRVNIIGGATSSLSFLCGASVSSTSDPTVGLIAIAATPTTTTGILESGISSVTAATGGLANTAYGNAKLILNSATPWVVCKASTTPVGLYDNSVTNAVRTFKGNVVVRISR